MNFPVISKHIKNAYKSKELKGVLTISNKEIVQQGDLP